MLPPTTGKAGIANAGRSKPISQAGPSTAAGSTQSTQARTAANGVGYNNGPLQTSRPASRPGTANARPEQSARPRPTATTTAVSRSASSMAPPPPVAPAADDESETATSPPTPTKKVARRAAPSSSSGDAEETNIQVVVRCRGPQSGDKEPPIVTPGSGAKTKTVTVQVSPSLSAVDPMLALAATKTYTFDRVFAHEADQGLVYQEVVAPMIGEVLMGYNCTIFAYGQTGTGKTYTMEGDLSDRFGTYADKAGIIPRTLYKLFHTLDQSSAEYSVRASYIELYNEELRDLLGPEENFVPSVTTTSMNSKPSASTDSVGLRIFEDASKKGVVIQGIEETLLANAADAIKLLRKGSHRRQSAATKCNDHSSRSHSVFTITVHIKETTPKGEEYLKIGKLNLVDLAGSENISRSGAENKRAREAGMINQSLLTLGRVINALVERSSHIPYRESKLTRLLQDSLGGRTKTCIIATISSQKSNAEETLSTLDYASRAKNIRNKPELNQKMTKKAFIKEYAAEIEKLKSDLVATRDKNGVFLSQQSFDDMVAENESQRLEVEDLKRQLEVSDSQLMSVREQFEQNMVLLHHLEKRMDLMTREMAETTEKLEATEGKLQYTEGQLANVRGELASTKDELRSTKDSLTATKQLLEEEYMLREAHQTTESSLDFVARGLVNNIEHTVTDIDSLHGRITRQSALEARNHGLLSQGREKIADISKALFVNLTMLSRDTQGFEADVNGSLDEAVKSQQSSLQASAEMVCAAMATLGERNGEIAKAIEGTQTYTKDVFSQLQDKMDQLLSTHESSQHAVRTTQEQLHTALQHCNTQVLRSIGAAFASVQAAAFEALGQSDQHLQLQESQARVLIEQLQKNHEKMVKTLQTRIDDLEAFNLANSEIARHSEAKLVADVTSLIGQYASQRQHSINDAIVTFVGRDQEALRECPAPHDAAVEIVDGMVDAGSQLQKELALKRDLVTRSSKDGQATVSGVLSYQDDTLKEQQDALEVELARVKETMTVSTGQIKDRLVETLASLDDRTALQHAGLSSLVISTQQAGLSVTGQLAAVEATNSEKMKNLEEVARRHILVVQQCHDTSHTLVKDLEITTQRCLAEEVKTYTSTGSTPVKRKYAYLDTWDRTLPHEELLAGFRSRPAEMATDAKSPTPLASPVKVVSLVSETSRSYVDSTAALVDHSEKGVMEGPLRSLMSGRKTMSPSSKPSDLRTKPLSPVSKPVNPAVMTKSRGKGMRTVSSGTLPHGHVGTLDKENSTGERATKRHQVQQDMSG